MAEAEDSAFVVDLDGFEGPLDLLLDLARSQKVDLARISILALAEQFIAYLEDARRRELSLAAEYLVMAAWLALMKSQLLLPKEEREVDDVEAMAEALAARLRKLDAIRRAVLWLETQPQLGDSAARARQPRSPPPVRHEDHWRADLAGLLEAYAKTMSRRRRQSIRLVPRKAMSVEAALDRLSRLLSGRDWQELQSFLPPGLDDAFLGRSAHGRLAGREPGAGQARHHRARPGSSRSDRSGSAGDERRTEVAATATAEPAEPTPALPPIDAKLVVEALLFQSSEPIDEALLQAHVRDGQHVASGPRRAAGGLCRARRQAGAARPPLGVPHGSRA